MSRSIACCLLGILIHCAAFANLDFSLTEDDLGVLLSGSGSVDTSGLTEVQTPGEPPPLSGGFLISFHDALSVGSGAIDFFDGVSFTGPSGFGPGFSGALADSGSGDAFGFDLFERFFVVPENYVSGDALSGSGFYSGKSLGSLNLTPGNYSWTDAGGTNTISLTIVPEPAAFGMFLGMVAVFIGVCRRRRSA